MGAEIEWHVGTIRFGQHFRSAATEDEWAGVTTIRNLGDGDCYLFAIAGTVTRADIADILEACARSGFARAFETRRHRRWVYDLTSRPFRRQRVT